MSEADLYSKLSTISNAFTLEKRFKKNYEIIDQIGIGGFAKVMKAKNLLDDMEYAIKKIKIETKNKSASEIVNELEEILIEIRCFAKIKHKHIVRYNHSWIEVELKENHTKEENISQNKLLKKNLNNNNTLKSKKQIIKKSLKKKFNEVSDIETPGDSSYEFSDVSYGCEISWEGINKSNNYNQNKSEEKEKNLKKNLKIEKTENEENYSFESSFYLEEKSKNDFPLNNQENICTKYDSEFSEFEIKEIGKIKNKRTVEKVKNFSSENDYSHDENLNNSVESISRINKLSEDYNDEICNNINKKNKKYELKKKFLMKNDLDDLKIPINDKDYKFSDIKNFYIYLQMELCKQTLEDFLKEKLITKNFTDSINNNNLTNNNTSNYFEVNNQTNELEYQKEILEKLEIFLEITKAINYLHESENIIHRDIKPQNIFFSFDGNIKVGDFGLATNFFNEKYLIDNSKIRKNSLESKTTNFTRSSSPPTSSNNENNNNNKLININLNNLKNIDINIFNNNINNNDNCTFYHTKNIGTMLYASPEQLNDNFYDYKSDIYSLGLVLFEMLNPFNTKMEKNIKFQDLKKGKIPQDLLTKETALTKLILCMCNQDPKVRPNSKEIIKIILKEISNKHFIILEANINENNEILINQENEYKNYFSTNSLDHKNKILNKTLNFEKENFVFNDNYNKINLDLRKSSSHENHYSKLNLIKSTLKYMKKSEDLCLEVFEIEKKNPLLFKNIENFNLNNNNCKINNKPNLQYNIKNTNNNNNNDYPFIKENLKAKEIENIFAGTNKIGIIDLNKPKLKSNINLTKLNIEQIQNKRMRFLSSEIEMNLNKEKSNTNNFLYGKGFFFERDYTIKENNPEKTPMKNIVLSEKNKVFLKMSDNTLLLFHNKDLKKADKFYDLLECEIKISENPKSKFTQISLEIPFYSTVYLFLEKSNENSDIIRKIKKENFIN